MQDFPMDGKWMVLDHFGEKSLEFVFERAGDRIRVEMWSVSEEEREPFEVSDVRWDGETLRFRSRYPETGHEGSSEVSMEPDGQIRWEFTRRATDRRVRIDRISDQDSSR